jgi:hypothetical protein
MGAAAAAGEPAAAAAAAAARPVGVADAVAAAAEAADTVADEGVRRVLKDPELVALLGDPNMKVPAAARVAGATAPWPSSCSLASRACGWRVRGAQRIIAECSADPRALQAHMRNPDTARALRRMFDAGLLGVAR